MIDFDSLRPAPDTPWVALVFVGGPRDGERVPWVDAGELLGSIRDKSSSDDCLRYGLQGFRPSTNPLWKDFPEHQPDEAVYLWGRST